MNETDKLKEEQFKKLPLNLQEAINDTPWKTLVQEIGKANALDTEQIASLEQETMFIIYAFEPPEDYIANIIKEVKISEDTAYIIAESVANKIFNPILKKSEKYVKATTPTSVPEIPPANLPMIEPPSAQGFGGAKKGEVAHEVPHTELTTDNRQPTTNQERPKVSLPDYRYEGGKDPYREPLK